MKAKFNNELTNKSKKDRHAIHKNWYTTKNTNVEKQLNKNKNRKPIRRSWADVKKDHENIDDFIIESMIHDEIESIFREPSYPEADWQKLERLSELVELKEFLSDFEYR